MPAKESIMNSLDSKSEKTGDKPGDDFNAKATWRELLEPRGWKVLYTCKWRDYGGDQEKIKESVQPPGETMATIFMYSQPQHHLKLKSLIQNLRHLLT
jgi:hypothetical protein